MIYKYQISTNPWKAGNEYLEDVYGRTGAIEAITELIANNQIQRFASRKSGNVFGYCVEISEDAKGGEKETAILISHKIAGLIWIELE